MIIIGSDIMKVDNPPQYHPATPHIAKFCISQLQLDSESSGITNVLHILTLLKDIFHHLPTNYVKVLINKMILVYKMFQNL